MLESELIFLCIKCLINIGVMFSDFMKCIATEEAPVIVFVSKMVPVERTDLPQNKQR